MSRKIETTEGTKATSSDATAQRGDISPTKHMGGHVASDEEDEYESIPDLAIDRPDPLPVQNPDEGSSTVEPAGAEVGNDVFYPPEEAYSPAVLATMEKKLPPPQLAASGAGDLLIAQSKPVEAVPPSTRRMWLPIGYIKWSELGLGGASRIPPYRIEQRAHAHEIMGQKCACAGRTSPGGDGAEIYTGQLDFLAAVYRARQGETGVTLLVDLDEVDDEGAYQRAFAEFGSTVLVAPIELARWAQTAIETTFKTQRALAASLGMDESNMARLLLVAKAAAILDGVIVDEAGITRNSADRFMQIWADKTIKPQLRAFIDKMKPATAAKIFSTIFARFGVKRLSDRRGIHVVGDDEKVLGSVRNGGAGTVVIELSQLAGEVELPVLMVFIEAAFVQLRNNK